MRNRHPVLSLSTLASAAALIGLCFSTPTELAQAASKTYNLSVKPAAPVKAAPSTTTQPALKMAPGSTSRKPVYTQAPTQPSPPYAWQQGATPTNQPTPTVQTGFPAGPGQTPLQQTSQPMSGNYLQQAQQAVVDAKNARNVLVILDASDSMNEPMEGSTKFNLARQVLMDTVRKIPRDVNLGLRVYGHKVVSSRGFFGNSVNEKATCQASELIVPIAPNNHDHILGVIPSVQAVGLTPITLSLQKAMADFSRIEGQKMIILISDGRDTCANVDPCDFMVSSMRNGNNIKVNTIGFDLHDDVATDQLKCVALSTKGRFFSADTSGQLADSLEKSMQVKTSVRARVVE